MGLPGVFTPVEHQGHVLIDGGAVNPVPYDLLFDDCDITVAIDVGGIRVPGKKAIPWAFDAVIETFGIMNESILKSNKRRRS